MFRRLALSLPLFLLSFTAAADEPPKNPPVVLVTGAVSYGASLTSIEPLAPAIVHGVGVLVPLKDGWSYYSEAAFATGFSEFQPGFLVITGPSRRMNDHLTLGATGMYKLVPSFDDAAPSVHIVGFSGAAILPTTFGTVGFPCGAGYNLTAKDPSLFCSAKVSIHLK